MSLRRVLMAVFMTSLLSLVMRYTMGTDRPQKFTFRLAYDLHLAGDL